MTNKDKDDAWNKIATNSNASSSENTVRTAKTLKLKYEDVKKLLKRR